jgi:hypothetical protein
MNRTIHHVYEKFVSLIVITAAMAIALTLLPGPGAKARASDAGAFIGGLVAGKVVGDAVRRDKIRTAAAVEAANQPKAVVVQQPASGGAPAQTTEQKLAELDKLASGGYITPEEYKQRRKAILDAN